MNKVRLMTLVKYLEKLPPKRFDYNVWVGKDWKGKPDLSCGTVACALGHATTLPSLRKAGLVLRVAKHISGVPYGYVTLKKYRSAQQYASFDAAAEVFGISSEEAEYLFSPAGGLGEKAKPLTVAKHIRRFIERGGMPQGRHSSHEF